jgi:hypothetical protein
VGVLVAVRSETESSWNLGVIRHVRGGQHRQHHAGVQLISKSVVPVYLRTLNGVAQGNKRQNALLLNTRPSAHGSLHIVARRDRFDARQSLEAQFGTPPATHLLEPGSVVESGYDFDWLRYKVKPIT